MDKNKINKIKLNPTTMNKQKILSQDRYHTHSNTHTLTKQRHTQIYTCANKDTNNRNTKQQITKKVRDKQKKKAKDH